MPKKIFILLILIISFGLLVFNFLKTQEVKAGPTDNVWGWAWAENIGWISFNNCIDPTDVSTCGPEDYGVLINSATGLFSGYAWARGTTADPGGIGWIKFDPSGPFPDLPNYSTCLDLPGPGQDCDGVGDYTVSGWARACAGTANPDTTCDGGPNPAAGGWDGWIKLEGTATDGSPYGISLNTSSNEFEGWAWGGDDSTSTAVVGWVSFNCNNPESGNVCPTSDYKVMTNLGFTPPVVVSNLTWNFPDSCAQSRIPTFTWVVDTTDPFDYQIRLCGDAVCAAEIVSEERSGVNSGYWSPSCSFCCSVAPYNNINFGGITYNAQVRTRHVGAEWLDNWANVDFTTYEHCYPWVDFNWSPKPVAVGPDVDFEDKFTCYDVPIGDPCGYNIATPSHTWAFPGIEGTNYECINPAVDCKFAQDPKIKFLTTLTSGSQVSLMVCDFLNYCCSGNKPITVTLPLPEYREVRPRSQLDNFLARIAGIFR